MYAESICFQRMTVLIDTWWNVNRQDSNRDQLQCLVLIDTWWNVNMKDISEFLLDNEF